MYAYAHIYIYVHVRVMQVCMCKVLYIEPAGQRRYMKATGTIAIVYQTLIPLIYVHTILPLMVTFLAVPFYYLIWTLCMSFWAARFRRAAAGISVVVVVGFETFGLAIGMWDVNVRI